MTFVPSDRFDLALARAVSYHRDHRRKVSGVPYVGHLLTVAGYVLEDGGSEDEAIAALLHDALEDVHFEGLEDEIRRDFGPEVLAIVEGCSMDNLPGEEGVDWRTRKERYVNHIEDSPAPIIRVSLADKLANVRSILRDQREVGDEIWDRFNAADKESLLWYYESLADCYARKHPGALAEEFRHEVARMRIAAG